MKYIACSCMYVLIYCTSVAQDIKNTLDKLSNDFKLYQEHNQNPGLFLHTDKSVYVPGETIWFTAYLLNLQSGDRNNYNTLIVALLDPIQKKVYTFQQYAIDKGLSQAALVLPDTVKPNDYVLVAYTNVFAEGKEEHIFNQLISIRSNKVPVIRKNQFIKPLENNQDMKKTGYSMQVKNIPGTDSMELSIQQPQAGTTSYLILHDMQKELIALALQMKNKQGRVRVPTENLNPGVIQVELLDTSLNTLANKLAWKTPEYVDVELEADAKDYFTRSITHWKVRLKDENGQPIVGIFSVGCVLARRILPSKPDIRKYYYLDQYLSEEQIKNINDNYEDVISNYTVSASMDTWNRKSNQRNDTKIFFPITGLVLQSGKAPKHPIALTILGTKQPVNVMTDNNGKFSIDSDALHADQNASVYLFVSGTKNQDKSDIIVQSGIDTINRKLAQQKYTFDSQTADSTIPWSEEPFSNTITLKTYTVRSQFSDDYSQYKNYYDKECDAYVCAELGVWMCDIPVHHKSKPVIGMTYYDQRTKNYILYRGCPNDYESKNFMKRIPPVYTNFTFTPADYSKDTSSEPQLKSTLYWNHMVATDKEGNASFDFYTNDLPGIYTCVIQGISEKGPFSRKINIEVISK